MSQLKQIASVNPYWNKETAPTFLSRTTTQYVSHPTEILTSRGISSMLLEIANELPDGAFIVGGAVLSLFLNNTDSKDIDIAFCSEKDFLEIANKILKQEGLFKGYICTTTHEDWMESQKPDSDKRLRFLQFTHKTLPTIQLLKLVWYEDPFHIIDSFDFTIVQFALGKSEFVYNPLGIIDAHRKRIVMHRMQFPVSSFYVT